MKWISVDDYLPGKKLKRDNIVLRMNNETYQFWNNGDILGKFVNIEENNYDVPYTKKNIVYVTHWTDITFNQPRWNGDTNE